MIQKKRYDKLPKDVIDVIDVTRCGPYRSRGE